MSVVHNHLQDGSSDLGLQGGGDIAEDLDEVGEWRGRKSDILDVREGGDTIRWGRSGLQGL